MPGLYGEHKLGSITYGSDTINQTLFGLSVDWERNGFFSGRNEARRLDSFTIRRGRRHYIRTNGDGFEQEDTGTLTVKIADPEMEYVPYNTSSPLYGKLQSNRRMNFTALTPDNVKSNVFTGIISGITPTNGVIPRVTLDAVDGWELLRGRKSNITVELREDVFADEIIPIILGRAGWPEEWGTDLNAGLDVQPYWWVNRQSAADAIFDVIHSELGRACIKADGKLWFKNRYYMEEPMETLTDADYIYDSLDVMSPWQIQRNLVTVVVRPRKMLDEETLWTLPQVVPINNGQSYEFFPDLIYNGEVVPAKEIGDPVPDANTLEDGSGTDISSGITVVREALGNSIKLTVRNLSGQNGFLRALPVLGKPIVNESQVPLQKSNVGEREDILDFRLDVPWIQNIQRADGFKDFLLEFLSAPKNYVSLTLKPNQNLQYKLDLGRTVRLTSEILGCDSTFSIAHIEHKYEKKRNYTMTTLLLEPVPDVGSYWRFGISAFGFTTIFAP
jgi:hypothetical protein